MSTGLELHITLPAGRLQPRRLLDSIERLSIPGPNPNRWLGGVRWPTRPCRSLTASILEPCEPDDSEQSAPLDEKCVDWGLQNPFRLSDGLKASTLDFSLEELNTMSTKMYEQAISAAFATELISGAGSLSMSLSSEATAPTGVAFGAATTPIWNALSVLEEEIASRLTGLVGYIHLPPGLLALAVDSYGVRLERDHWETPAGNVVISDAGYVFAQAPDGQAASPAGSEWVYASGPVFYDRTDVQSVGMGSELVNLNTNRIEQFVEGMGILVFDPCPVTAVLVSYNKDGAL